MLKVDTIVLPSTEWDGKLGLFSGDLIRRGTVIWTPTKAESMSFIPLRGSVTRPKWELVGFYHTICNKYVVPKDEFIFLRCAKTLTNSNLYITPMGELISMITINKEQELLVEFKDFMTRDGAMRLKQFDPKEKDMSWLFTS
jgi:hypothetical protein